MKEVRKATEMETKVLLCNGIVIGTYRTEETKYNLFNDYMRLYGIDSCDFEIRTRIYKAVGLAKLEDVQYQLYREQASRIMRNFRRGLLSEFQMENSLTDLQKDWFKEWYDRKYTDNICKLTAELLSEKSMMNIQIEED